MTKLLPYFIHLKNITMQSKIREFLQRTAKIGHKKMLCCIILVMGLSSFSTLLAQRQPMDTAAMRKRQEEMLQQMKTDLKLTDVQADSVSSISKEFNAKRQAIFMDQSVSMDDKRAQMQPLNEARDKRLKAALGDDLFAKYQAWMQEHRPQRGGGRMGGGNGGGGNGN
jgi:hypothetical protein